MTAFDDLQDVAAEQSGTTNSSSYWASLPRWLRELRAYDASEYKRTRRIPSLPRVVIGGEVIGG